MGEFGGATAHDRWLEHESTSARVLLTLLWLVREAFGSTAAAPSAAA